VHPDGAFKESAHMLHIDAPLSVQEAQVSSFFELNKHQTFERRDLIPIIFLAKWSIQLRVSRAFYTWRHKDYIKADKTK
jgi:hypothetical protein